MNPGRIFRLASRLAPCLAVAVALTIAARGVAEAQVQPESLSVYLFEPPSPNLPDSSLYLILSTVRPRSMLGYQIQLTTRLHDDTLDLQVDSVTGHAVAAMVAPATSSTLLPAQGYLVLRIRQGRVEDTWRLTIRPDGVGLRPIKLKLTSAPALSYYRIPRNSALVICEPAGWPLGVCQAFVNAAWRELGHISVMPLGWDSAMVKPYEDAIHRWTDTTVARILVHGVDSFPLANWRTFTERYTNLFGGQSGIYIHFTTWSGDNMMCNQGTCR